MLSGKVTVNGQPAKDVTVVALVSGGGHEASGLTGADGTYRIVNPPKGAMKFRLSTLAPPPPPGITAPPPPPGATAIPPKYTTPENGLSFEYSGGKKTYNIDIK
ncbi:hypothetical protein FRUB_00085 [Fimbriiglobus ruber]|uniref:Carboxypeptidase regulatory-like domain-containing protein n=1 Tax=Fimbriiglobus ruber TaxID=1908690 RepID=A0A225E8H6_9BACT|nr:hypothetical protein FRUB_00085 [Fimbriiglobus ruber]